MNPGLTTSCPGPPLCSNYKMRGLGWKWDHLGPHSCLVLQTSLVLLSKSGEAYAVHLGTAAKTDKSTKCFTSLHPSNPFFFFFF